jgi:DNA polymerase-3 subunit delta'
VLIIWLPEKMRKDAANKLLKILEEPPAGSIFILVSESSEQLLPTIRSRTQLVKIPLVANDEIENLLTHNVGLSNQDAIRVAKISSGNLGIALSMASAIKEKSDFQIESDFIAWMRMCYNPFHVRDNKSAWIDLNNWIDYANKNGKEYLKKLFVFSLDAARECMLLNTGLSEMSRFDDAFIPGFSKFSKFINPGNVVEISGLLNKAYYAVERNANTRILLLDLSFKLNTLLNKKNE